jgi:hypothetical protein
VGYGSNAKELNKKYAVISPSEQIKLQLKLNSKYASNDVKNEIYKVFK